MASAGGTPRPPPPAGEGVTRVKASLGGTIRRLGVPPPADWAHLAAAVGGVYGVLPARLAFSYIDDEGDVVALSCDADLAEACRLVTPGGVLRLVLREVEAPSTLPPLPVAPGRPQSGRPRRQPRSRRLWWRARIRRLW